MGVDYYLGEVKLAAGTVNVADGSTVTITARAQTGFVLEGPARFTHTFPVVTCSTSTSETRDDTATNAATNAATGTTGTTVEVIAAVTPQDTAVAGVKTGQIPQAAVSPASSPAGALSRTGAGLPLGMLLSVALLLLLTGATMLAITGRTEQQLRA
jgi:hypothetical protein